MKISIGTKIEEGPFGGGNSFVLNLQNNLKKDGHIVVDNLVDIDIDIILLFNPLVDAENSTFNNFDIDYYQNFINPLAISIQRINECDERKNTNYINKKIISSNKNIDVNIYVSRWLNNLYKSQGLEKSYEKVILGGPDENIFNDKGKLKWDKKEKLRIVTHHWSDNWMKGFTIYKKLDRLLDKKYWKDRIEFTLIGNFPNDIKFRNTNLISPLNHESLSEELKKHHVYITASLNEPSGNHHMEAALTRLPIIYIESGGTVEYCKNYGVQLNESNIEESINKVIHNYDQLWDQLQEYPYSFGYAYTQYIDLFQSLLSKKEDFSSTRINKSRIRVVMSLYLNKITKSAYWNLMYSKRTLGKIKRRLIS